MSIAQGDVWWADLPEPERLRTGISRPSGRRPGRRAEPEPNRDSRVCSPNEQCQVGTAPGNVLLSPGVTGLSKESVANVSQIVTLDKTDLTERAGKLPRSKLELVLSGIDVILGR